jgi:hypothetical protein
MTTRSLSRPSAVVAAQSLLDFASQARATDISHSTPKSSQRQESAAVTKESEINLHFSYCDDEEDEEKKEEEEEDDSASHRIDEVSDRPQRRAVVVTQESQPASQQDGSDDGSTASDRSEKWRTMTKTAKGAQLSFRETFGTTATKSMEIVFSLREGLKRGDWNITHEDVQLFDAGNWGPEGLIDFDKDLDSTSLAIARRDNTELERLVWSSPYTFLHLTPAQITIRARALSMMLVGVLGTIFSGDALREEDFYRSILQEGKKIQDSK